MGITKELTHDPTGEKVTKLQYSKDLDKHRNKQTGLGRYILRTSVDLKDELLVWDVYNTIREVEATFRTLKSDLDLRPIYHKNDDATMAHLHMGILAYSLVNTLRCKLKASGVHCHWKEIVRIGNTQKVITTTGYNSAGNLVETRKCSRPTKKLKQLHRALNQKSMPFTQRKIEKSVVHKSPLLKKRSPENTRLP